MISFFEMVAEWVDAQRGLVGGLLWVGVAVALGAVLVPVLVQWRRRRRAWTRDAGELLRPAPRAAAAHGIGVALAIATGLVAWLARAPLPLLGTAIAVLGVAHLQRWRVAGWLGLGLLLATWSAAGRLWLPLEDSAGGAWGLLAGGVHVGVMGLAWRRQWRGGAALTTSGWLAPAGVVMGGLGAAVGLAWFVMLRLQ